MNLLKRSAVFLTSALLMFSLVSCDLETRDTYEIDESGSHTVTYEEGEEPTMTIAEKTNSLDSASEAASEILQEAIDSTTAQLPDESSEKKQIVVSFAGDVVIDETIIADAAHKAEESEGKDYSFLSLYTGVYRLINDADISFCSYSTINVPSSVAPDTDDDTAVEENETEETTVSSTPAESFSALEGVGFDVIDTSGAADAGKYFAESEVLNISTSLKDDDGIAVIEKEGVAFAFVAIDAKVGAEDGEETDDSFGTLEYADIMSDILVVSVHWADTMSFSDKEEYALRLAEAGADIIIGDGDAVSEVKWIETEDGTSSLVAYSLGNLISDADEGYRLVSGILTFTLYVDDSLLEIADAHIVPVVMFYNSERSGFQTYKLDDCNNEIMSLHGAEVNKEGLWDFVSGRISSEFLGTSESK